MPTSIKYIPFIFFIFMSCVNFAQDYTMTVVPLDIDESLMGNRVSSMLQDHNGFIWMLTQNGLARYDGHNYKWLNKTNSQLRNIPLHNQIAIDGDGYIWLNQYNKVDLLHSSTFEIIHLEEKFKEFDLKKLIFNRITQVNDGTIFFRAVFEKKAKSYWYHPKKGLKELDFIDNQNIGLTVIKGNTIWCSVNYKWTKYDLATGKVLKKFNHKSFYRNPKIVPGEMEEDYFHMLQGNDWVILEALEDGIKEYSRIPNVKSEDLFKREVIYYDSSNDVLISMIKGKISLIQEGKSELIPIETFPNNNLNPFNKIFLTDNQGIFWGTVENENRTIYLGKIATLKFKQYSPNISTRGLWTNEKYLFSNKAQIPLNSPHNYTPQSEKKAISVESNIKDVLWRSSLNGIENVYSENGVTQPPVLFHRHMKNKVKSIWSLLRDDNGRWWGGLKKGLVASSKIYKDSLYLYEQFNEFEELKSAYILHLVEDGQYIWSASSTGLHLIDKEKGVVKRYASDEEKDTQLPIDFAQFIYKDDKNVYWVATNADGLVRFELDAEMRIINYKTFTIEDGLSSNVLYTIVEDDKERLWISTLHGLSCFNKKTKQIQAFFKLDGLGETEFNRISYAKGADGRIFFGTIKGVIGFYPDEIIKKDTYATTLSITQFEKYTAKDKEKIDRTSELRQEKQIKLLPSDRFMRLTVSLMDYFHSKNVRYTYKIEGLFNDFQLMDGNTIEIGGLPYGRYQLIVQGQGANRRFSDQKLVIPLIVVRPFYLKWWFILFLVTLGGVSIAQFYFWRVRRLEERKNELELIVKERTSKIKEQTVKLEELDKLKSKFFANISHELRTPLTLILAPLSNLFRVNQLSNKQHTQLMLMRQNGKKLLKRINELLDLSRLDANKLKISEQPTLLYLFFKNLVSTFESAANLKNIQLLFDYQLDENLQILIDDDKLEKIVSNYFSNALKFTPKNGIIHLIVSKQNQLLQVEVKDTGIGILKDELTMIFDRFYQAKTNDATQHLNPQGSGIGLSLCQELAKAMKGRIGATSEIGKGSTFFLELPLIETFAFQEETIESEEIEAIPVMTPPNSTNIHLANRPNLLIVEDNPDLRTLLILLLEDQYEIETFENGKEALDRLKTSLTKKEETSPDNKTIKKLPALIISDIMMPVMDGMQLLTEIKKVEGLNHIPFIMLTARQSLEVKLNALRIGVDDYLTKPFTQEELIARVANLIENSKNRLSTTVDDAAKTQPKLSNLDLKWIQKVEEVILDNVEKTNFTMNDLALVLNISKTHMIRKIKQITGLSPKQYERSIKLAKARELLKSGEFATVSEVVYRLGFNNHYYFSQIYKKAYGIMPTQELKE